MSGFTGKTVTTENVPGDIAGPRKGLSTFIQQQGFGGLMTGTPDIDPYRELFKQQNAFNNAQAKEDAGNLTGSGFANTFGRSVARANVEQGAFLADLLERSKQQNASRFASVVLPFLTTGVGAPTTSYQPGFLDYAAGAGTALAGGGAFNKFFGAGQTRTG